MNAPKLPIEWKVGARALLCLDGLAGVPVTVIGHHGGHVRIALSVDVNLPNRRRAMAGELISVPAHALKAVEQK